MKRYSLIPVFDLQLFAEGTSGDGGAGQGAGVTAPDAGEQQKGAKARPLADVKYGIQPDTGAPAAEVQQPTTEPAVDRNAEFEKLIKGQYKDLYDSRVQDTVQKRLKGQKETVEKYNALTPVLEILAKKYGVDASDSAALSKAIQDDDAWFAEEAAQMGVSVEELKRVRKLERENAQFRAQAAEQSRREQAAQQYATWMRQAEEAKALYPNLDLDAEAKNPQFVRLLQAGVDVGSAYLVLHKDDIIPAAMQHTAKTVEQKLVNAIAAQGLRPAENGMNAQGGSVVKNDVSKLNKADRAEINRRVARGERITFG